MCIMTQAVYKKCNLKEVCPIVPSNVKSVIGVGGKTTQVIGEIVAPLTISGVNVHQNFLVIPKCDSPDVILGENFLYEQRANIDFSQGTVSLQNGLVTVKLEPPKLKQERVYFVKTKTDVTVRGQSECLLPVRISSDKNKVGDHSFSHESSFGVIQPTVSLPKDGVLLDHVVQWLHLRTAVFTGY